jgi:UDP-GlcNAc:undecaprenyl-phosphate GlcNAc-1-phosphate transferase
MLGSLTFFLMAAVLAYLFTPHIYNFANWAKIFDVPSERKIHKKPVPLLGGIPIFISFNLTIIASAVFGRSFFEDHFLSHWPALLLCQIIILSLGLFDDLLQLGPSIKFLFQIFVGVLIVLFGFGIHKIANPFNGEIISLRVFSFPVTIIWFVLITNALNLVDGLDGLAAGTACIASMTIFAVSYFNQNMSMAVISAILGGSLLGFLKYNFYPAKIFLGSTGSLLIGFLLAFLSIQGSSKGATLVAVMAPILALGLPIMETVLSMIRRFLRSIHVVDYPRKNGVFRALFFKDFSLFTADLDHVHHRLIKLGFSQKKAVFVLYGVCVALSLLAFFTTAISNINFLALMGTIVVTFFIVLRSLKYEEFKVLKNGLLIPIFNLPIISRRFFLAFFDLGQMAFSLYLCFILVFGKLGAPTKELFVQSVPIFLLIKIIIFHLSGIYKISWFYSSFEEVAKILGAVFLSSLGSLLVSMFVFGVQAFGGIVFFVLDFYLLLTFAGGLRVSYRFLNSYYRKGFVEKGKKILIYGAGYRGSSALKEIRNNGSYMFSPVGFIDDDPHKIGKTLHGCPVLGSSEDLEKISAENEVTEIIISSEKIGKERIKKILEFCRNRGIVLRQFEFRFYEFP